MSKWGQFKRGQFTFEVIISFRLRNRDRFKSKLSPFKLSPKLCGGFDEHL